MGNEMARGEPSYGMAIMSGRRSGKMQELVDKLHGRCEELATERDNILDRYNHSVSENTNLRSRCEKLNAMCIELATDYAKAEAERDEADRQHYELRREYNSLEANYTARLARIGAAFDWLWGFWDGNTIRAIPGMEDDAQQAFESLAAAILDDADYVLPVSNSDTTRKGILIETINDLRAQLAKAEDWAGLQFDLADKWHNENNEIRRQLAATEVELDATAMELDDTKADLAEARNKALDEAMASLTPGIEQCFTFRGRAAIRWALIKVLNLKEKV